MSQPKQTITSLPLAAPISIVPAPNPTEVAVREAAGPGGQKIVIMQFATRQGVAIYFLSAESAKGVAAALNDAAGGILVVPAGTIQP